MFYYAYAASQSPADKQLTISVPSGNFGNLVAGVMAWKMGAPIHCFRAPTTINDTVPRYFASGRVEPRPSVQTLANAMDVGNSEQPRAAAVAVWRRSGRDESGDHDRARTPMTRCGRRSPTLFEKYGYVADPHTAIGYLGVPRAHAAGARALVSRHRASGEVPGSGRTGDRERRCRCLRRWPPRLHARKTSQRIRPELAELSKLL